MWKEFGVLASMVFPKKKNSAEIKEGRRKWALASGGRFYHQNNSDWRVFGKASQWAK